MMLHPMAPVAAEKIEAQAVFLRLVDVQQLQLEARELRRIDLALEHGVLNPLPEAHARFGNLPQALAALARRRRYVVGHENEHGARSLPHERRVRIEIAAEVSRQETGLQMQEQTDGRLLAQERVHHRVLLPLLVGRQYGLPGALIHLDSAGLRPAEAVSTHLLPVD